MTYAISRGVWYVQALKSPLERKFDKSDKLEFVRITMVFVVFVVFSPVSIGQSSQTE